jgi:uncharacterized protein YukE
MTLDDSITVIMPGPEGGDPSPQVTGWPGLGFDPVPGGRADRVGELAARLDALCAAPRGPVRLDAPGHGWTGQAAEAFTDAVAGLPARVDAVYRAVAAASAALDGWRVALEDLGGRARGVERDAREARRRWHLADSAARAARAHPDLQLDGQHFDTDEALADAQRRLDTALGDLADADAQVALARAGLEEQLVHGRALAEEYRAAAGRAAAALGLAAAPLFAPRPGRSDG